MFDSEALDRVLKDQIARTIAAIGLLLLVDTIIGGVLTRFATMVDSTTLLFDGVWNLSYLGILAALITGGLWGALAVTRSYEQPWWLIVVGAFAGWSFIIAPVAVELPNFLTQLVLLAANLLSLVGVMLAIATLDRSVPTQAKPSASVAGSGAGSFGGAAAAGSGNVSFDAQQYDSGQHGAGQYGGQQYGGEYETQHYDSGQYGGEQGSGIPPGWYPDPHGEASSRWWDGNAWSNNVR